MGEPDAKRGAEFWNAEKIVDHKQEGETRPKPNKTTAAPGGRRRATGYEQESLGRATKTNRSEARTAIAGFITWLGLRTRGPAEVSASEGTNRMMPHLAV